MVGDGGSLERHGDRLGGTSDNDLLIDAAAYLQLVRHHARGPRIVIVLSRIARAAKDLRTNAAFWHAEGRKLAQHVAIHGQRAAHKVAGVAIRWHAVRVQHDEVCAQKPALAVGGKLVCLARNDMHDAQPAARARQRVQLVLADDVIRRD